MGVMDGKGERALMPAAEMGVEIRVLGSEARFWMTRAFETHQKKRKS